MILGYLAFQVPSTRPFLRVLLDEDYRQTCEGVLLLMIEILHDVTYQNPRNYGSLVYMGSCKIFTMSKRNKFQGATGLDPQVCSFGVWRQKGGNLVPNTSLLEL